MKTLILFLLTLTVAPCIDAQEKTPLTNLVWWPDASFFNSATYEDGECGAMEAGYKNLLWYVAYELPDHRAPDSVTFVLKANCEFSMFSGWSPNNQNILAYDKNRSGAVTVAYKRWPGKRDYCVGVAVAGWTQEGDLQAGTVCVDAAYAWYPTADVDPVETLIQIQQVQWYDVVGRPSFYGTQKELQVSGLRGLFFTKNCKYIRNE